MKLNQDKFIEDESKSNQIVTAIRNEDCPANYICFFMAMGGLASKCDYLEENFENMICTYPNPEKAA